MVNVLVRVWRNTAVVVVKDGEGNGWTMIMDY